MADYTESLVLEAVANAVMCRRCGSMVISKTAHDSWHADLSRVVEKQMEERRG